MSPDNPRRKLAPRIRRLLPYLLGGLGLLLIGLAAGGLLFAVHDRGAAPVVIPGATASTAADPSMPDVVGMREADAVAALRDAGLTQTPATRQQPYAGATGMVVRQIPDPGATVTPQASVTLHLSSAATVPDVTGRTAQAAADTLRSMGATVTLEEVVTADASPGVVLSSKPTAKAQLSQEIRLLVATSGDAVALADLQSITSGGCRLANTVAEGTTYERAVVCGAGDRDDEPYTLNLGRHAVQLLAEVGIADDDLSTPPTLTVLGDERKLATIKVRRGALAPLAADVTGVLHLQLVITGDGRAVLGNARLTGTSNEIDLLIGQVGR